ncbi:MAG: DUF1080 domain-containing protein [Alphaproteobacteria bacterium]|nr:MAG: DUF1080 domain-containing protein [Alphaproteobacteria bacterium]
MRIATGLAFAALMLGACGGEPPAPAAPAEPVAEAPAPAPEVTGANSLTAEQTAQGWKLLFNGTDLTGWKGYKKDKPGDAWKVEDGTLALTAGRAGDLMTVEEYGPFELSYEWKISPNGNSGVIYLIQEDAKAENTYNTGPEMQVLDNDGHADGKIPSHRAGALYDIETPPDGAVKPVGEWNEAVVRFTGSEIEHWLNGKLVSESSYGDDAWKAKVAASKFKQWPLFGTFAKGHIALQDHGDKVWYRNIKVRAI